MKAYAIIENKQEKDLISANYNYKFNKVNGMAYRWGKTLDDDPDYSEFGPEILDLECTTICCGVPQSSKTSKPTPCSMCYKSNTEKGVNMSFDTFKTILDKYPRVLTQIAFGADSQATANPDLWKMMEYSRSRGIIPNITVANISDDTADKLVKYCGAVAVSRYAYKDICYNSIQKLTDRGMVQVNIHICVAEETFDMCMETLKDRLTDPRLQKLRAIVMLSLKRKGRGTKWHNLSMDKFQQLIQFALDNKICIGFDSCGAHKFTQCIKNHPMKEQMMQLVEPCEATLFSSYISVDGKYYPCSFSEGSGDWKEGLDVVHCQDFIRDIWMNKKTIKFRNQLLKCKRNCPIYDI